MTDRDGLDCPEEERVALATLELAQAALPPPDWPVLEEMGRLPAAEDNMFLLEVPIGGGHVAPLEVRLYFDFLDGRRVEAKLLANAVRRHLTGARVSVSRLKRVRRVAEAFAAAARARGAPIEVEAVGIEPHASAWDRPAIRFEVTLTYVVEQMRREVTVFRVVGLKRLRDDVAELADMSAYHARTGAALTSLGAIAFIDPIAHAAMTAFGVSPLRALQRLSDRPYAGEGMTAEGFRPHWNGPVVNCEFQLGSEVQWFSGDLSVRQALPQTVIAAAPGRRLRDLVAHPIFAQAVVAEAEGDDRRTRFTIKPLTPLMLMAEGSVVEIPPPDREAVLALVAEHRVMRESRR